MTRDYELISDNTVVLLAVHWIITIIFNTKSVPPMQTRIITPSRLRWRVRFEYAVHNPLEDIITVYDTRYNKRSSFPPLLFPPFPNPAFPNDPKISLLLPELIGDFV